MTDSPISINSTASLSNNSNSNNICIFNTANLAPASNEQEGNKTNTEVSVSLHQSADASEILNDTQSITENWGNALKNGAEYSKYAIQKGYEYAKAAYDPAMKGIEWSTYCIQNVSLGAHKAFDSAQKICSTASTVFGWMNEHPITTTATAALWYSGMLSTLLYCAPVITPVALYGIYLYEEITKESIVSHEKPIEQQKELPITHENHSGYSDASDVVHTEDDEVPCTGLDIYTQHA